MPKNLRLPVELEDDVLYREKSKPRVEVGRALTTKSQSSTLGSAVQCKLGSAMDASSPPSMSPGGRGGMQGLPEVLLQEDLRTGCSEGILLDPLCQFLLILFGSYSASGSLSLSLSLPLHPPISLPPLTSFFPLLHPKTCPWQGPSSSLLSAPQPDQTPAPHTH